MTPPGASAKSRAAPSTPLSASEASYGVEQVSAAPTKDLFISMLVKDIELPAAVMDLLDNSVDGARRLKGNGPYGGLQVAVKFDGLSFTLEDNCGGIPRALETYAFRFGRPRKTPKLKHSVGQFGIGMKRGVFKMGQHFVVMSEADSSRFSVEVDVPTWAEDEDDWTFPLRRLRRRATAKVGTTITVTNLFPQIGARFSNPLFEADLVADIALRHQYSLSRGLTIQVNGNPVSAAPLTIRSSADIRPVYQKLPSLNGKGRTPLHVRLYCGVSASEPRDGGWYVFCNGRLVLDADQDELSGWGSGNPRYHPQFAAFRGYVFFDSDDPARLPWNTMKTGVDPETDEYAATRQVMIGAMRPVIDFLNRLADEERSTDSGPLRTAWETAPDIVLAKVKRNDVFIAPKNKVTPRSPTTSSIQYEKPIAEIAIAKRLLKVRSNRRVGERTFEYFLKAEGVNLE